MRQINFRKLTRKTHCFFFNENLEGEIFCIQLQFSGNVYLSEQQNAQIKCVQFFLNG